MSSKNIHTHARSISGWLSLSLGLSCAFVFGYGLTKQPEADQWLARLLPRQLRQETPWKTITELDIENGVTIPADTNVIIKLPESLDRITRRTLFGRRGLTTQARGPGTRYWGYCFPKDPEDAAILAKRGFPGTIFLSEQEREYMAQREKASRRATPKSWNSLTEQDLNEEGLPRGIIRHQKEIFYGGDQCYIMTAKPLPIGLDPDGDGANNKVEKAAGSDINNKDSDGDGITDGLEIFALGSNPRIRDSDGDGLIDGMEDKNKNGRLDPGETSPTEWDTDRDGLCDGLCKVDKGRRLAGEDMNLNGIVDEGETSPLSRDTDEDGILDEQEYLVNQM